LENNHANAVLIARFQVAELSEKQIQLIARLSATHKRLLVVLEESPVPASKRNPLDVETRKLMLLESFPALQIQSLKPVSSMQKWSETLDKLIEEQFAGEEVVIYGEEGMLDQRYFGVYKYQETTVEEEFASGEISDTWKSSTAFRKGAIHTVQSQYAKVNPTVDIAIIDGDKLLLGRKPNQEKFRFIGGFADPADADFEQSARREAEEETGLKVEEIRYAGSAKIDDWRYREEEDKIITTFFIAKYAGGTASPKDDIEELKWFEKEELKIDTFVEEHVVLYRMLLRKWK
jgi:bifunctional NMN adenylyltransferase/nudix hydrolase